MTQEDKELLIKDLCARLPYHTNLYSEYADDNWAILTPVVYAHTANCSPDEIGIKPYLFPISSMTEKILEELNANGFFKYRDTIANVSHLESKNGISEEIYTYIDIECISFLIEYFHSHHIDYRGLIEKNLAIDATGLNIY